MHQSAAWHLTITRLVPPIAGGRWLCALGLFPVLAGVFLACGVFDPVQTTGLTAAHGPALFFSVVLSYTVPILHYISARTVDAIGDLRATLNAEAEQITRWQRRVWCKPRVWFVWVLSIGTVSGIAHNLLLFGSLSALLNEISRAAPAAIFAGTCLIWVVLTLTMAALLDNARLFADLGRRAEINLLQPQLLRPFGTVAVISTLAVIGIQAAFPIMFVDSEVSAVAYIPGLIPTTAVMFLLAAMPVWPVHRRLAGEKALALTTINQRIDGFVNDRNPQDQALVQLAPLLTYRQEIAQVSEWPVDIGVVTRLGLYLIIPPLTWVGAALIERLVDDLV